jgi:hypothetical protein
MLDMLWALSDFYYPSKERKSEAVYKIPPVESGYNIVLFGL